MQEIAVKLLEVQKELGAVKKDKKNPFFSSNYADINKFIEVVKPILNKHGLVLIQPLSNIEGQPAIRTILVDGESGDMMEDVMPIILKDNDPQKVGSAITYYRRYALQSFLFLEAEDDDGNKASAPQKSAPKTVPSTGDLGVCEFCGVDAVMSAKGKPYCPQFKKHPAGQYVRIVPKGDKEFIESLPE